MASKVSVSVEYSNDELIRYHFEQTTNDRGEFVCIWDKAGVLGLWKVERYNNGVLGRDWVRQIVASELGGTIVKW